MLSLSDPERELKLKEYCHENKCKPVMAMRKALDELFLKNKNNETVEDLKELDAELHGKETETPQPADSQTDFDKLLNEALS